LADELPPDLRGRIALRHVEAVSQFSPQTQRTLAEVLATGIRAPAAIVFLKEHPEALLAEVVANCRTRKRRGKRVKIMEDGRPQSGSESDCESAVTELTDLLTYCYPDMPQITAQAMATSELLAGVLAVIRAQQACLATPQAESDFVLVVLCGLACKNLARLDQLVSQKPAYMQALQQSGVPWPGLDKTGRTIKE
jgi:transcription-repair coupling factor (superfamily II helicase)